MIGPFSVATVVLFVLSALLFSVGIVAGKQCGEEGSAAMAYAFVLGFIMVIVTALHALGAFSQ